MKMNTEFAYEGRPKSQIERLLASNIKLIAESAHEMEPFELKEYQELQSMYRHQLSVIAENEAKFA